MSEAQSTSPQHGSTSVMGRCAEAQSRMVGRSAAMGIDVEKGREEFGTVSERVGKMTELFLRLSNLLSRVTYKPGWMIEAISPYDPRILASFYPKDRLVVLISMTQPSVDDPKVRIVLSRTVEVSCHVFERMSDYDFVQHFVSKIVWEMECHEMNEWLKFDGKLIKEPHPEERNKKEINDVV